MAEADAPRRLLAEVVTASSSYATLVSRRMLADAAVRPSGCPWFRAARLTPGSATGPRTSLCKLLTLSAMQDSCSLHTLENEAGILSLLIANNRSQHRRTDYYQKLVAVRRGYTQLRALGATAQLHQLADAISNTVPGSTPIGMLLSCSNLTVSMTPKACDTHAHTFWHLRRQACLHTCCKLPCSLQGTCAWRAALRVFAVNSGVLPNTPPFQCAALTGHTGRASPERH